MKNISKHNINSRKKNKFPVLDSRPHKVTNSFKELCFIIRFLGVVIEKPLFKSLLYYAAYLNDKIQKRDPFALLG